ncbi:hypothetical protein ACGFIF_36370 [Kribbella sp. NPDC049174]|uniref:hypothetical protein n=1 Tax=Kribbella sp. NPDC049174 TaxID=3364112 RepID=UPI0037112BE1
MHDLGNGEQLLTQDALGADQTIPMDRFDVGEVGRVVIANGWQWTPPGSTTAVGDPTAVPEPIEETRIALRDGRSDPAELPAKFPPAVVVPVVIGLAVVLAGAAIAGVSPTGIMIAAGGLGVAFALGITVMAIVSVRQSSLVLTITPYRVSLTHGTLTSEVVQRTAVATASVADRWIRLRSPKGRSLIWIPFKQRRDEVLGALARNGWPTSESHGGLRRHL